MNDRLKIIPWVVLMGSSGFRGVCQGLNLEIPSKGEEWREESRHGDESN